MAFPSPIRIAALAAISSSTILGLNASAAAGPLSLGRPTSVAVIEPATFWARPYPYGYAYTRGQIKCWAPQRIETPTGPAWERVWVCGRVTSRY